MDSRSRQNILIYTHGSLVYVVEIGRQNESLLRGNANAQVALSERTAAARMAGMHQAARRRTSQMVAAMSSTDSASSQPPSIRWKSQNRLPGW